MDKRYKYFVLRYNRETQEARTKEINKNFDKNYVPPRKSMFDSNELPYRKNHENIKFKSPLKSPHDVQDFPYENVDKHFTLTAFPKQKSDLHEMENEKNNFMTSDNRKTNTYDFPIERENKYLKSHSIDNIYDFPQESKKHYENYKPILEKAYLPVDSIYKKKNFKGSNHQYELDFPLETVKDQYHFRNPVDGSASAMDFHSEMGRKENNFKNPDYSYSPEKSYDNSLSFKNEFESGNENINFNAPKENLNNHNFNFDTKSEYQSLPESKVNDFSWTHGNIGDESLDSIVTHHMKQRLPGELKFYFSGVQSVIVKF